VTAPSAMNTDPARAALALEVVDLHKSFGQQPVLAGVGLELRRGSVHALLGENGAGKSTLVKCVMGYHRADRGRLLIDGQEVVVDRPQKAQALGVGMVYQHFTLVPNMTVAENLVLARARLPLLLDWGRERAALAHFMSRGPFPLPLETPVRMLAAGEKQKLEILKQLYLGSRIVILDEPTSVLTPQEADEVLGLMRRFTREANLSILLITHKFREVSAFADDVTVLRRGRVAGRGAARSLDAPTLAEMMVGSRPAAGEGETGTGAAPPRRGAPVLRVDALEAADDLGLPALRGATFDVHEGEIVGLAGIAGNGQEELVEVLAGQRARSGGRLLVGGREYQGTRTQISGRGVRCLPEDPLRNACVPSMTVAENLALRDFDQPSFTIGGWGLRRGRLQRRAEAIIGEYQIRARGPDALMTELSGGNVQRTVLARELDESARLLVVANPCMGLDFRAVAEIHRRLRQARSRGMAILLVSADLDEILALSDRILVVSEGRIVHQVMRERAELGVIGQHMAGEKQIAHA
jgi:general nucleoside transport system ATP-binding protein